MLEFSNKIDSVFQLAFTTMQELKDEADQRQHIPSNQNQ